MKAGFFFNADSLEILEIKSLGTRNLPELIPKNKNYKMKVLKKLHHKTTMDFQINKGSEMSLYLRFNSDRRTLVIVLCF
jgi:hypothetical protein